VEREEISPALASRLVGVQFPQWADLPITPVAVSGWDNVTFRLGESMAVRLPTSKAYAAQVDKEHRWLPILAPQLPLPIPEPLARGEPGLGFPWPWSVYRWFAGTPASVEPIADLGEFGSALGAFLAALHRIDPRGAPPPSDRSFFRAGPLAARDDEIRGGLAALDGVIDSETATQVWEAALAAPGPGPAVWIHGDVSPTNLLVVDGRLSAVIDFGCSGAGDPAFDAEIAWGFLSEAGRAAFRMSTGLDEATWARARGWKLWASLPALLAGLESDADWVEPLRHTLEDVLEDHKSTA